MREFIFAHIRLQHLFCGLILMARLGDVLSTYLVTPKLQLEANPVIRRLGWRFAVVTLLICLIPYWSTAAGVVVLVPSLMVSGANTSKIWFARAYGESEYHELLLRLASKTRLASALAPILVAASFIAVIGLVLLLLSPDPRRDWGYWFAMGFLTYAVAIGFYGSMFTIRLFRRARSMDQAEAPRPEDTAAPGQPH